MNGIPLVQRLVFTWWPLPIDRRCSGRWLRPRSRRSRSTLCGVTKAEKLERSGLMVSTR